MLLSSFLYRRMRICKFQHAAGVCPNNAPAKPPRPHHRKLVPDPLAVDPVYVWAYHPLIVRLWRIIQRSTQRPPNGCVQADAVCRFETRVYPWDWYTLRGSSDGRNNCCSSETRFDVGIRILPLLGKDTAFSAEQWTGYFHTPQCGKITCEGFHPPPRHDLNPCW